jgi:protein-tyrosine kinase
MSKNFELLNQLGVGIVNRVDQGQEASRQSAVDDAGNGRAEQQEAELSLRTLDLQSNALVRQQIAQLIQKLFLPAGGPRAVVFSGLERGAGCSWIAARVASFLASQINGSVCLVDANLRYPAQHDIFGISNHHGFSDALGSSAPLRDFVRPLAPKNLWLLSCGSSDPNASSLLAMEALRARLLQLRTEFDYILIDTPPANQYTDALTLCSGVDGLVLILKANSSRRDTAQKFLLDLRAANLRLLGAILNRRAFPVPESLYKRL